MFGVVGVALGVAAVFSIDLANGSARRAFRISAQTVAGKATHRIVGGPSGLDESLYATLRLQGRMRTIAPVVEGYARIPGFTLHILGVDPFAEAPFRNYTRGTAAGADIPRLLTGPGAVLLLEETAKRMGVSPGNALPLRVGLEPAHATLSGFLRPGDDVTRQALETTALADIATAQELLGKEGRLSRIDLLVPEGAEGELALSRVREILPPGAEILPAGARGSALEQMTRAFSLNLSALSLLALVVGTFLVYNTMTFSVLQRRQLVGTLRALGVTRGRCSRRSSPKRRSSARRGRSLGFPSGTSSANFSWGWSPARSGTCTSPFPSGRFR